MSSCDVSGRNDARLRRPSHSRVMKRVRHLATAAALLAVLGCGDATTLPASKGGGGATTVDPGLVVFGSEGSAFATKFECNAVDLVFESNQGHPGTVVDAGGNQCLCGNEERLCKALSAGLEPPSALPDPVGQDPGSGP
jgi:hypothetical protein